MAKTNRFKSTLSIAFSIIVVMLAWSNFKLFGGSYNSILVQTGLFGILALGYIVLRQLNNASLPRTKLWPLVLAVFVYLVISMLISPNFYAGAARFLYLAELGIFFLIAWDILDAMLDHEVVLYSFLAVTMGLLLVGLFEVYRAYSTWWAMFGFLGESPPFMYRIVSLMNSSNPFTALLNMFLPIAVVLLIKNERKGSRIFLLAWLMMYLVVMLFSSSRGGMVGAAAAVFFLLVLNLERIPLWQKFLATDKKTKLIWIAGLVVVLALAALIGLQFLVKIGSHPSHGGGGGSSDGGLNLNRTGIWLSYINIWKAHPLLGSGIGRHPFAFFQVNDSVPPGFWPSYAHSFPIAILAEFGGIGVLLIFGLIVLAGIQIYRHFRTLPLSEKLLASGVLAGVLSMATHSIVDDFLNWPYVFFHVLLLVAWLASYGEPIQRSPRLKIIWVIPALIGLLAFGFWYVRPYQYLDKAMQETAKEAGNWTTAATYLDQAVELAPNSHYYLTQAAFFWYHAGLETGSIGDYFKSDQYFSESLAIEPGLSIIWLNKSLVSWKMGDTESAIEEARTAVNLAPKEPIYHLNLGWYYEEIEDFEQASSEYTATLNTANWLRWYSHPFWTETSLRGSVRNEWLDGVEQQEGFPQLLKFVEATEHGDWQTAQRIYQETRWEGDIKRAPEQLFMLGILQLEGQEFEAAAQSFSRSYGYVYHPLRLTPLFWWTRLVYYLDGYEGFLPGTLELSQDFGNLDSTLKAKILAQLDGHISENTYCELIIEMENAAQGKEQNILPLAEPCP